MFGDDSCWRDIVSFTWNIKTAEGTAQVQAMLEGTTADLILWATGHGSMNGWVAQIID